MDGLVLFYIIMIAVDFALAAIPANIASGKGHSFGGFYVFGLFLFLPALIVALCINDEVADQRERARVLEREKALMSKIESLQQGGAQTPTSGAVGGNKNIKFCTSCGGRLEFNARFCDKCGTGVKSKEELIKPVCASCGKVNAENARFCDGCGASLPEVEPIAVTECPKCNAEILAESKFCDVCGVNVAEYRENFGPSSIQVPQAAIEDGAFACPKCGARQQTTRNNCYRCGVEFLYE
ncbi:MAG: zinc ribbon domain-containing protein [Oscillospiraceae bacterium]|jgi:predicted RNA-binding Zn-ribbon protein involved in translation (DUF1610 family)|nr:zinc ribbon domain-containing protein [Oscillospiraceae bacterium]